MPSTLLSATTRRSCLASDLHRSTSACLLLSGHRQALVAVQPTIGALVSRASAIGASEGAAAGLAALAAIDAREVFQYQPYWAALAHLEAGAGHDEAASRARARAIGLSTDPAVRRFLAEGA